MPADIGEASVFVLLFCNSIPASLLVGVKKCSVLELPFKIRHSLHLYIDFKWSEILSLGRYFVFAKFGKLPEFVLNE